jgi:lysine N6-hydroxylase
MQAVDKELYDVIGIGIGPSNLSLAALIAEKTELKTAFFDQTAEFRWHPGMLLDSADNQVSFIADLVTFANPKSQFTYLNYLYEHNRLYKFFFYHKFEIPRLEYNDYAKWVSGQLLSCHLTLKSLMLLIIQITSRSMS